MDQGTTMNVVPQIYVMTNQLLIGYYTGIKICSPTQAENEKRRREAEALQARMEREKQELRDYIEKDNKGNFYY